MPNTNTSQHIFLLFDGVSRGFRHCVAHSSFNLHELTLPQIQALMYIRDHKHVTMNDLAQELHVAAPTATTLIDKLIAAQWIIRTTDEHDRRSTVVSLTDAAKNRIETVIQHKLAKVESLLECLDSNDRKQLHRILEKIHLKMERSNVNDK